MKAHRSPYMVPPLSTLLNCNSLVMPFGQQILHGTADLDTLMIPYHACSSYNTKKHGHNPICPISICCHLKRQSIDSKNGQREPQLLHPDVTCLGSTNPWQKTLINPNQQRSAPLLRLISNLPTKQKQQTTMENMY